MRAAEQGVETVATRGHAGLAALPMYDPPELHEANDTLWAALRQRLEARGVAAPPGLTRTSDLDALWSSSDLLIAQTCGYPLVTRLRDRVRLVLTPRYRAQGCDGPFHRAAVVVRKSAGARSLPDLKGGRLALNGPDSNTGMNLLRAEIAPIACGQPFFSAVVPTGSHAQSAAAGAAGRADLASLDCVTWALLQRLRPALAAELTVLAWTPRSPGLPLVTSRLTSHAVYAALQAALGEVIDDPTLAQARRELLLEGFEPLASSYYTGLLHYVQLATDLGYSQLI